jgi:ankyrin repeat protein
MPINNKVNSSNREYIVFIIIAVFIAGALAFLFYDNWNRTQGIFDAAEKDDISKVRSLLEKYPRLVNTKQKDCGLPLLFYAKSIEMVKLLIAYGADVNSKGVAGVTPLHTMAGGGLTDVVELLILKGADINAKDSNNDTPLNYAVEKGFVEIIKIFISHGADVNVRNNEGYTSLGLALKKKHMKTADLLREHGAKE